MFPHIWVYCNNLHIFAYLVIQNRCNFDHYKQLSYQKQRSAKRTYTIRLMPCSRKMFSVSLSIFIKKKIHNDLRLKFLLWNLMESKEQGQLAHSITYFLLWHQLSSAVFHWKATSKVLGWYISSIFYNDIFFYAAHQSPEFFLYQLSGNHLKARRC